MLRRTSINPDRPLGAIRCGLPAPVRPEPVEGLALKLLVIRQAHHERSSELFGITPGSL